MQLSQISVQYQPEADRLLLRVKSVSGELYEAWLTRRLVLRWWPHAHEAVDKVSASGAAARVAPGATVLPQAQPMLAQAAKDEALRVADFKTPFNVKDTRQPMGKEPMLAVEVQMTTLTGQQDPQLRLTLFDAKRNNLQMQLTEPLAIAVRELLEQALAKAQWGVLLGEATGSRITVSNEERVLN